MKAPFYHILYLHPLHFSVVGKYSFSLNSDFYKTGVKTELLLMAVTSLLVVPLIRSYKRKLYFKTKGKKL